MLFLLTLLVVTLTATAHRYLRSYAPSNVLIARLRTTPQRWRTVGASITMTMFLLAGAHGLDLAIASGAPAWLNLAALILAWDAIKLWWLALGLAARSACRSIALRWCRSSRRARDQSARRGPASTMIAGNGL